MEQQNNNNNQPKPAGGLNLKTFWDRLIIAAAMSNCAMGMTFSGESAEGFIRLQKQMDELDQKDQTPKP